MRRTRSALLALLVVVPAALLASCSGGDPAPDASAGTARPTPTGPLTGLDCLESGTWAADPVSEGARYAETLASLGPDATAAYSGEWLLAFERGTLTRTYEDWTLDFSVTGSAGSALVVRSALDGTVTARYTANEDAIETQPADISDLGIAYEGTEGGVPFDASSNASDMAVAEAEARSWAYACEDGALSLWVVRSDGSISEGDPRHVLSRR